MDSKSISRKGVGVRLPSLAPSREDDPVRHRVLAEVAHQLGAILWPALERELRVARMELDRFVGELRVDRAGSLRDDARLARQEELSGRTRRMGWCLGVLAAAEGIDLLHARREPDGLRWMVGALAGARAFTLAPLASELPSIESGGEADWLLSLLAGWCTLEAGAARGLVRWTARRTGASLELAFEARASALASRADVRRITRVFSPALALRNGELVLSST